MGNHPSILAGRIPWTEDPGGLEFMGRKDLDTADTTEYTSKILIDSVAECLLCARYCIEISSYSSILSNLHSNHVNSILFIFF